MSNEIVKRTPATPGTFDKSTKTYSVSKYLEKSQHKTALMRRNRQINKEVSSNDLQALFMFDITGSMFRNFKLIREKLQEIFQTVLSQDIKAEFAIMAFRNHGDEDRYEQIYYSFPFTSDIITLQQSLSSIEKGGGGRDFLTCMEDCLREANSLEWKSGVHKSITIIGDRPPHGVVDSLSKCPKRIDYREEIKKFIARKIPVYAIYCDHADYIESMGFFEETAKLTKGRFMHLEELDLIAEILIGVCMKSAGRMNSYMQKLQQTRQLTDQKQKALLLLNGR